MNTMNPTTTSLTRWLADPIDGHSLVLTPQGDLYVDTKHDQAVEDYLLYAGNTLHLKHSGEYSCIGLPFSNDFTVDLLRGDINVHEVEDRGCMILHESPVVKEGEVFLAYFKWAETLFLVVADSVISQNLYIAAMEGNREEDGFMLTVFMGLLARHDNELANNVATWLVRSPIM